MGKSPDQEIQPTPRVINSAWIDAGVQIDILAVAQTMQELGISPEGLASTSVQIDDKKHFIYRGSHTPKTLDRFLRGADDVNEGEGSVVRVSTNVWGKEQNARQMNAVLVHEFEHVAQSDRKDVNMKIGNLAIWGLAAVGAIVGNHLGKKSSNKLARATAPLLGFVVGHQTGYRLAPHERQARARAKETASTAIRPSAA